MLQFWRTNCGNDHFHGLPLSIPKKKQNESSGSNVIKKLWKTVECQSKCILQRLYKLFNSSNFKSPNDIMSKAVNLVV